MSGTRIAYDSKGCLRACYEMSSTGLLYGAICGTRSSVLSSARGCTAQGIDLRGCYGATRVSAYGGRGDDDTVRYALLLHDATHYYCRLMYGPTVCPIHMKVFVLDIKTCFHIPSSTDVCIPAPILLFDIIWRYGLLTRDAKKKMSGTDNVHFRSYEGDVSNLAAPELHFHLILQVPRLPMCLGTSPMCLGTIPPSNPGTLSSYVSRSLSCYLVVPRVPMCLGPLYFHHTPRNQRREITFLVQFVVSCV